MCVPQNPTRVRGGVRRRSKGGGSPVARPPPNPKTPGGRPQSGSPGSGPAEPLPNLVRVPPDCAREGGGGEKSGAPPPLYPESESLVSEEDELELELLESELELEALRRETATC